MSNNIVTKAQLVDLVSVEASITKAAATKAIESLVNSIVEQVSLGNKVTMSGLGSFTPKGRSERKGRNPQTGEEITIKASTAPVFKASKNFKEKVSELAVEQLV